MLHTTALVTGGRGSAPAAKAFIAVQPAQIRQQLPLSRQSRRYRTIAAWIVAAGMGLGAALYPLPHDMKLLELYPPGDQSTESTQVGFHWGSFSESPAIGLMAFEGAQLSDVLAMGELLGNHPELPVDAVFDIVHAYGLPGAVELLGALLPNPTDQLGGGGYMPVPSGGGNTSALPALVRLLEYLGHAPMVAVGALSAVVTNVLPAVLRSVGVAAAPAEPSPVAVSADSSPAATAVAPDPVPSEPLSSPAPEPPAPAPTAEPASAPAPDPAPQPTQAQPSPVAEPSSSGSTVTNDGLLTSGSRLSSGEVNSVSGASTGSSTGGTGLSETSTISADLRSAGLTGGSGISGGSSTGVSTAGGSTTSGSKTDGSKTGGGSSSGGTTGGGGSSGK